MAELLVLMTYLMRPLTAGEKESNGWKVIYDCSVMMAFVVITVEIVAAV